MALKHIGDVIVATPALLALKEFWPQAELELLVGRGMGELVRELPQVTKLQEIDRAAQRGRPLAELALVRSLRARCYDVAIDLTGGERSAWYVFLSGAPMRVGVADRNGFPGRRLLFQHTTPWGAGHYAQNMRDILVPLGIVGQAGPLKIAIPARAKAAAERMLTGIDRPRAVIHPVSRWMFKSWPIATCAATIRTLIDDGVQVILSSGPAAVELDHNHAIMDALPEAYTKKIRDFSGKTTL
ncbi:MAG TPA: glycosyltransferase family 9 protein, partial [bacterium]|nr:glycosyltransferase family 9 protein [bacterium]